LALFAATLSAQPVLEQVDLFVQRTHGVHSYRIPALIETKKGVLIAVADARRPKGSDLPNDIALVMRRSRDGGRTWSEQTILTEAKTGGVGDPSLLLDHKTGRVWCFHAYGPPGIGTFASQPGTTTGPTTLQVHAMYTDNDGDTWSEPEDLSPRLKDPAWMAMFVTSGTNIQTRRGRYLLPLVVRMPDKQLVIRNAYSDDAGKSWKVGEIICAGCDESRAIELADGTILENMRKGHRRLIARSKDGGVTFSAPEPDEALIDPICNAGLVRYAKHTLVFTNAASLKRERMTVKLSRDDGKTWSAGSVLHAGPAGYSTVIRLRDGSLGVFYERGDKGYFERLTFARFNLKWVEAAR
jgi:sialidase-1